MDPLRTISRYQKIRLQKLGAAVSGSAVTATEDQLWRAPIVGGQRQLLNKRAQFIADTGGGGGGAPEWVPDNAKIYIDLVGDRAWTEAAGEVAIDTLLGADANTSSGWGTTSYIAGTGLDANGYSTQTVGNAVALIGAARTSVTSDVTIVVKVYDGGAAEAATTTYFDLLSADGNDAIEVQLNNGGLPLSAKATSWGGSLSESIPDIINAGAGSINAFALTLAGTRFELAVNGSTVEEAALSSDDRPAGNPLVAAILDLNSLGRIQSITLYDALPSTVGLSALSAP